MVFLLLHVLESRGLYREFIDDEEEKEGRRRRRRRRKKKEEATKELGRLEEYLTYDVWGTC